MICERSHKISVCKNIPHYDTLARDDVSAHILTVHFDGLTIKMVVITISNGGCTCKGHPVCGGVKFDDVICFCGELILHQWWTWRGEACYHHLLRR